MPIVPITLFCLFDPGFHVAHAVLILCIAEASLKLLALLPSASKYYRYTPPGPASPVNTFTIGLQSMISCCLQLGLPCDIPLVWSGFSVFLKNTHSGGVTRCLVSSLCLTIRFPARPFRRNSVVVPRGLYALSQCSFLGVDGIPEASAGLLWFFHVMWLELGPEGGLAVSQGSSCC